MTDSSPPKATDLLVEYDGDPAALDALVQTLGPAVLGQGSDAPGYMKRDGCYVVRVYGDPGFVRFALTHQGYVKSNDCAEGVGHITQCSQFPAVLAGAEATSPKPCPRCGAVNGSKDGPIRGCIFCEPAEATTEATDA